MAVNGTTAAVDWSSVAANATAVDSSSVVAVVVVDLSTVAAAGWTWHGGPPAADLTMAAAADC